MILSEIKLKGEVKVCRFAYVKKKKAETFKKRYRCTNRKDGEKMIEYASKIDYLLVIETE